MTKDATADATPLPSFGSRRPIRGVRGGLRRRRSSPGPGGVCRSSPVLPDPPSALVGAVDADPCASPSARKPTFVVPAKRANGSRERAPDDGLREALSGGSCTQRSTAPPPYLPTTHR